MRSISRVSIAVRRMPRRARACSTRTSSSATSGTTRFAASVGVEARRSATSSSSGRSASCPIARDDGGGRRGRRPDEALVAEAQQVLEVAAAAGDDDDVDLGVGVESPDRGDDLGRRAVALHRRVGACGTRTAGQRSRALRSTSFSASLSLPVIRPTTAGRNGSGSLRRGSNSPSAASWAAAARAARAGRRGRRASCS